MVYLHDIIIKINDTLATKLSMYPTADYKGIAAAVTVQRASGSIVFPSVITLTANNTGIYFDNTVPYVAYHRLATTSFSAPTVGRKFGNDDTRIITSTTNSQIVVMGNRDQLNTGPEQLAMFIADSLPSVIVSDTLTTLGIGAININPSGIEYDQRTVFNREYQGVKYFIGPELFILAVRYTIEGVYMKGCTNKCIC